MCTKVFRKLNLFILVVLAGSYCYGQQLLRGTVTNNRNRPIAKAQIYLDSVNSYVKTDKNGNYEVPVPEQVEFINVFSPKYGLLSTEYKGETKMDFIYINGKNASGERIKDSDKVSIGYDEVENKYYASRVENVEADERIDAARFLTIYDLIRDRLPGVRVTSDNKIIIRGVSSFVSSQDPLFVVDGQIVNSIDYIPPVDVKDISVLKGAEASIYGSRAASGVILIKTRK
jgi:TonB-dependent SusC/RagA subfamily outer membrane receptor